MKPGSRKHYHAELWPAVCAAQGWDPRDKNSRRDICLACMEMVRGPMVTTSHANFDDAETTALFVYLRHLAEPDNINRSLEWDKCRADYRAYNTAKRADWWELRGFGQRGSQRLRKNRFGGRRTAQGGALDDPLTRAEADQRLWKMRQRTREREAKDQVPPPRGQHTLAEKPRVPAELLPF